MNLFGWLKRSKPMDLHCPVVYGRCADELDALLIGLRSRHEEEQKTATRVEPLKAGVEGQDLSQSGNEPSPYPAPEIEAIINRRRISTFISPLVRDGWQPIVTAPDGVDCWFWLRPKTADETYTDTSGRPILAGGPPFAKVTRRKQ